LETSIILGLSPQLNVCWPKSQRTMKWQSIIENQN